MNEDEDEHGNECNEWGRGWTRRLFFDGSDEEFGLVEEEVRDTHSWTNCCYPRFTIRNLPFFFHHWNPTVYSRADQQICIRVYGTRSYGKRSSVPLCTSCITNLLNKVSADNQCLAPTGTPEYKRLENWTNFQAARWEISESLQHKQRILFNGRSSMKQYLPLKPTKSTSWCSYKLCVLSASVHFKTYVKV